MRPHKGIPSQRAPVAAHDVEPFDDSLHQVEPAWLLEIACCCPSRPAVRVVMPKAEDRLRPAELLLCAHHCRSSRDALIRSGASVYDRTGSLISSAARLS
jgi:hypothetical protein